MFWKIFCTLPLTPRWLCFYKYTLCRKCKTVLFAFVVFFFFSDVSFCNLSIFYACHSSSLCSCDDGYDWERDNETLTPVRMWVILLKFIFCVFLMCLHAIKILRLSYRNVAHKFTCYQGSMLFLFIVILIKNKIKQWEFFEKNF